MAVLCGLRSRGGKVSSRTEHTPTAAAGYCPRLVPFRAEKGNSMIKASAHLSTSGLFDPDKSALVWCFNRAVIEASMHFLRPSQPVRSRTPSASSRSSTDYTSWHLYRQATHPALFRSCNRRYLLRSVTTIQTRYCTRAIISSDLPNGRHKSVHSSKVIDSTDCNSLDLTHTASSDPRRQDYGNPPHESLLQPHN